MVVLEFIINYPIQKPLSWLSLGAAAIEYEVTHIICAP